MANNPTDLAYDRLAIARLILIRTKELELRQAVAPRLRGARALETAAEITRLTEGIARLHQDGLARLRAWRTAVEKADGQ